MVVYKTTNNINNKIYIGQDKKNNPKYLGSGNLLKSAIKKYGRENFTKEILCICETIQELNEKEKYYIIKFSSTKEEIGYNISFGGTNGTMFNRKHTKETKEKMSKSSLGKKKSKIHCENIGLSKKGRHVSDEEKRRRSVLSPLKGIKKGPLSYEIRKKISDSKKGKLASKETKEKMSKNRMGINNPFYGKKHSEEYLLKKRIPILQLSLDNQFIKEWQSISDAGRELNIFIGNISKVLSGKYKTTGGYKFIYKNGQF